MDNDKIIVSNEEILKLKREYLKEWRARNKDRVKQHNKNYWVKKAQKNRAAESNSEE